MDSKKDDINVQDIMDKIRSNIDEEKYSDEMSDIENINYSDGHDMNNTFSKQTFDEEIGKANHQYLVEYYRKMHGNKLIILIKKFMRRVLAFTVGPLVDCQNDYNSTVVRILNQMKLYLDNELSMENRRLSRDKEIEYFKNQEKLIQVFESEIIALKIKVDELEKKLESKGE